MRKSAKLTKKLPIIVQASAALVVTAALSGCGLVSNIIGERSINDPFGVDNQEVGIALTSEENANLAVQAEGEEGTSFTFADEDFSLRGFEGDYIKSEIGFTPTVRVSKPLTESYPESFTIDSMSATLTLSDEGGANGATRTVTTTSTLDGALTFERRATCTDVDLSCGYTYDEASGVDLAKALLLELGVAKGTDVDLREAIRIIQLDGEGTPNTATVSFAVTTDSNPDLAGSILSVTLKEGKSVVKL